MKIWIFPYLDEIKYHNPSTWGYMGGKVNLYLDDEAMDKWSSLPTGLRSRIVRQALMNAETSDPQEREILLIQEKKRKIQTIEMELDKLQAERAQLKLELRRLQRNVYSDHLDIPPRSDVPERYLLARDFWSEFLDWAPHNYSFVRSFKPSKIMAMMRRTDYSSVQMGFVIRKDHVRVEMYIYAGKNRVDEALHIYNHLLDSSKIIENEFGRPLIWQESSKTARRIYHRVDGIDIRDRTTWKATMEEMGSSMELLWKSLEPVLISLPEEEE